MVERDAWNACRFRPGTTQGHYESYFQRANHPTRPLAFWIRYTIFSPRGRPEHARGELWAIYFDGEHDRVSAVKESLPLSLCRFSDTHLHVQVGDAVLVDGRLSGSASSGDQRVKWELEYESPQDPLLLLDRALYDRSFPKAKVVVGSPNAIFRGSLSVNGRDVSVEGWRGSQNHNWGSKHTDEYAWGQVAGFDEMPGAFFECATARLRIGPLWSPWLTSMVLRLDGVEYRLNSIRQALRARGRFRPFTWSFGSIGPEVSIRGRLETSASTTVTLRYENPPGGEKVCLNSKLASCDLSVERRGLPAVALTARHRAAFEIVSHPL